MKGIIRQKYDGVILIRVRETISSIRGFRDENKGIGMGGAEKNKVVLS